ncbi:methyltransferase family protein [Sphingomonas bacterium]|uniref:methyltransferase family protein n=1 Tax=Sphingomonas bacterium TaxID=1895847 RepID=UPI001576834E|nr:isoprenylcysteine carboxylmethyltransferase family protein [Sphingomonas bacterium]
MIHDDATSLPALAALLLGFVAFAAAALAARRGSPRDTIERAAQRSRRSMVGIGVQMLAFVLATAGPQRIVLAPVSAAALLQAAAVLLLWGAAVALFVAATRTMGRNWSLVARTRDDHQLVQSGPFAAMRHPIYTAIALELVGCAVALGHSRRLLIALPIYALGTWLRVAEEERLLRAMFGPAYDAYAARVKRFVPGVF